MQKRRLGRTNLEVSVIGFGGIPIIGASKKEAYEIIRRAFELGINYFDTARVYGDSEEKFGEALKDVRDNVVLATKTHQRTREDAARAGLRHSLRNLKTDRIDIVQLHGIDDEKTLEQAMSPNGSLAALKEARAQGKIDFIGISGHVPHVLAKALKTGEFDTVLVPFNILTREATEELLPLAKELDVGVIVMKPFGGADLSFVRFEFQVGKWIKDISEFESFFGKGKEKVNRSLRFILAHPVSTIVPGFSSIEEVETAANVGKNFNGLTPQEIESFMFGKLPPEPFCRSCGFCMPCPEGLNIPLVLTLHKYFTFYGIKRWTKQVYEKLSVKVEGCTECGKCQEKCPYKLPVVNMLRQTENLLAMQI
jgi:predicted aldo/keto reductase-like oxidoreductase